LQEAKTSNRFDPEASKGRRDATCRL
jgi:hypothetical protein